MFYHDSDKIILFGQIFIILLKFSFDAKKIWLIRNSYKKLAMYNMCQTTDGYQCIDILDNWAHFLDYPITCDLKT